MRPGKTRCLCILLAVLVAASPGFAQAPAPPVPAAGDFSGPPLKIIVLEGRNAVNSIPLLQSIAPVVEINDQNDMPVEGANVVFSLPSQGPAGGFAIGGTTFSTRSDARGQATAPAVVPRAPGRFEITVTATAGNRRGMAVISQTNSMGTYSGRHEQQSRPFYKRKLVLIGAAAVVTGVVLAVVLTSGHSNNNNVTVTPGAPVFQ